MAWFVQVYHRSTHVSKNDYHGMLGPFKTLTAAQDVAENVRKASSQFDHLNGAQTFIIEDGAPWSPP